MVRYFTATFMTIPLLCGCYPEMELILLGWCENTVFPIDLMLMACCDIAVVTLFTLLSIWLKNVIHTTSLIFTETQFGFTALTLLSTMPVESMHR